MSIDNGQNGLAAGLPEPQRPGWSAGQTLLTLFKALASLRLTVFLFVLALILVFVGTLAQVEMGIWTAVEKYFRSWYVWVPNRLFAHVPGLKRLLPPPESISGGFPFFGGWAIGAALFTNLLAAHALRFKYSWKRSGILILHAGLAVIMLGEFVTGLYSVESTMTIAEEETCGFADVSGRSELAFVSAADPNHDDVVVISQEALARGGRISDAALPVDVEVLAFYKNSKLTPLRAEEPARAELVTTIDGRRFDLAPQAEQSGVDPDQREDAALARIRLYAKESGQPLGEYLVSIWFYRNYTRRQLEFPRTEISVDGRIWQVELRPKRIYKPFQLTLLEFRHDVYIGTSTPKNFSSRIRLRDPERNEDREVVISMNDPFRYRGETYYQSGYLPNNDGTVLQVVRNPGWLMPYVSCTLVGVGMLIHFGIMLVQWINLRTLRPASSSEGDAPLSAGAQAAERFVPAALVGAAALLFVLRLFPPGPTVEDHDFDQFSRIPVVDGGRVKPMDTFARTTLMQLSERQTYVDDHGRTQPAVRFILELLSSSPNADFRRVFRIENDEVRGLLGLPARDGYRYAYEEFADKVREIFAQAARADGREPAQRSTFDVKIIRLARQVKLYHQIANREMPLIVPGDAGRESWHSLSEYDVEAVRRVWEGIRREAEKHGEDISRWDHNDLLRLRRTEEFRAQEDRIRSVLVDHDPNVRHLDRAIEAFRAGNVSRFNDNAFKHLEQLERSRPEELWKANFEVLYNRSSIFYYLMPLYVVVFLVTLVSWMFWFMAASDAGRFWMQLLNRSAFWLLVFSFALHSAALMARIYIQERPPVTNLYSSAIFVGWGCIGLGLFLEMLFRNGLGSAVAGVIGLLTLIIAHFLGTDGDTLEMMQAVLDTNFWLATHVVIITLGYAATFLAGGLGLAFILLGLLTPMWAGGRGKTIGSMIYGVLCFATFCSFVGTVLGGIWADQSWGRFWGWDPKENGALLIVIWNALILHARWAGMVKLRGIALLTVGGMIITAWSWFGTNLLGVGLHAYGFRQGTEMWLSIFWVACIVFVWVGLTPVRYWSSFASPAASAPPPLGETLAQSASPRPETAAEKETGPRGERSGGARRGRGKRLPH